MFGLLDYLWRSLPKFSHLKQPFEFELGVSETCEAPLWWPEAGWPGLWALSPGHSESYWVTTGQCFELLPLRHLVAAACYVCPTHHAPFKNCQKRGIQGREASEPPSTHPHAPHPLETLGHVGIFQRWDHVTLSFVWVPPGFRVSHVVSLALSFIFYKSLPYCDG